MASRRWPQLLSAAPSLCARATCPEQSQRVLSLLCSQSFRQRSTQVLDHHVAENELEIQGSVFKSRPTRELLRTLAVYQLCAIDTLVDNSLQLMRLGERLLGLRLLQLLLQPFYRQFVAGAERSQLNVTMTSLRQENIRFMMTSMLEADVGEGLVSEEQLTSHLEETIRQITMIGEMTSSAEQPAIQNKITAHMDVSLLVKASPVFSTASDQTSLVESLASAMMTGGQVKVPGLTAEEQRAWDSAVHRLKALGDACVKHGLLLYIDGEFSYTNAAISWLTLALMTSLNQERAVVRSTQQCYLKVTPDNLEREHAICRQLGARFGAKLVRGAYMTQERRMAQEQGRPSPVCDTYEDTTANYTRAVEFGLRKVAEDGGKTQIMVASHNHQSILHALGLARSLGISSSADGGLGFGQVYGMADYLSVPLARAGHTVYKAVPFGEFSTVMPYLSRRAAESKLLQQGVRVERKLLLSEIKRRMWSGEKAARVG